MKQDEDELQNMPSMEQRLVYIFEHEYKPDFIVYVGVIEQPSFGRFLAHQGLLAACSKTFRKLLRSRTVVLHRHLHFSCSHAKFFREILRYMYAKDIKYDSPSDFGNIRQHAIAYQMPGLVAACDKELKFVTLYPEDVVDWLIVSFKYDLLDLRNRCDNFITANAEKVFRSEGFTKIKEEIFEYILKCMKFRLSSELVLMETIMKWIEENEDHYERYNYCIPSLTKYFLKYVKFIFMNARDFEKVLLKYREFFTADIALDIFKVIINPHSRLPSWMRAMSPRPNAHNSEKIPVYSGPNFAVQYRTFLMPMEESRVKKQSSSLETMLRVRCNWMPTVLIGATLICPGLDGKGGVKLHWECHTSGCFEEISNTMSFDRHVKVKKNRISIKFPKQFVLETSVVFHLSIKIEYDEIKFVDLPSDCVPSSGRFLFTPYGRNPYFDGDIIVSEILYI